MLDLGLDVHVRYVRIVGPVHGYVGVVAVHVQSQVSPEGRATVRAPVVQDSVYDARKQVCLVEMPGYVDPAGALEVGRHRGFGVVHEVPIVRGRDPPVVANHDVRRERGSAEGQLGVVYVCLIRPRWLGASLVHPDDVCVAVVVDGDVRVPLWVRSNVVIHLQHVAKGLAPVLRSLVVDVPVAVAVVLPHRVYYRLAAGTLRIEDRNRRKLLIARVGIHPNVTSEAGNRVDQLENASHANGHYHNAGAQYSNKLLSVHVPPTPISHLH
ncbi:MAG: hypothetical protein ACW99J_18325 [Candidatus Thorarchaeota archaeon]